MDEIRTIRNNFLSQTDIYMISDYPLSSDVKQQLIQYRQQLRDLPGTLNNVTIDLSNIGQYFPQAPIKLVNPFF